MEQLSRYYNIANSKIKFCRKCHIELLLGINCIKSCLKQRKYLCNICRNDDARAGYRRRPRRNQFLTEEQIERRRETSRLWALENPDKKRASAKKWRLKNPKHNRLNYYLREYGLTWQEVIEMLGKQKGACQICREPLAIEKTFSLDHDHKTQLIRGILCIKCNAMLGNCNDRIEVLESAIAYLRRFG